MPTDTPTPSPLQSCHPSLSPSLPLCGHRVIHRRRAFHCHCTFHHRRRRRRHIALEPSITVALLSWRPSSLPLHCHPAIYCCRCCAMYAVAPSIVVTAIALLFLRPLPHCCRRRTIHRRHTIHCHHCHCIAIAPSIAAVAIALPARHLLLSPLRCPLLLHRSLPLLPSPCHCTVHVLVSTAPLCRSCH